MILLESMPMIENAIRNLYETLAIKTMTIADLGCSSGPNTLLFVSKLIDITIAQLPSTVVPRTPSQRLSALGRAPPEAPPPNATPCPRRRTRAVRAADPRSVHGVGRTRAGRGAVARRNHPSSPHHHPESARIKGRRILPQPRCPSVLPRPLSATFSATAETQAPLTPGVVRVAWHLPWRPFDVPGSLVVHPEP
jgi:hypothetical protein